MSKQVDKLKKERYKQARLDNKSKCKALSIAGYSEATAKHHQHELAVVKCGEQELLEEFKATSITVEYVLEGLTKEAEQAKNAADRIRALELLGKYQAMFTDKQITTNQIPKDELPERIARVQRLAQNQ